MNIIGIIPARYASTRFPGKPLVDIGGKSMIRRVYEQASKAKLLKHVIVATDDIRIYNEVKSFGGEVVMTSADHKNGTERCADVASSSALDADVVVNVQGDEPFIDPEQIDLLASCFDKAEVQIATLVRAFKDENEKQNPSRVKAFVDIQLKAITFSRSATPARLSITDYNLYKHVGIYAFRKNVLLEIVKLPSSPLELEESLEQLRWLENNYAIQCAITTHESISVDTPEDLKGLV